MKSIINLLPLLLSYCILFASCGSDTVDVTGISLNSTNLEIVKGSSVSLNAKILPEDASDKTLVWISSDQSVASVDNNGLIYAHKSGTTKIKVSSTNGISAECSVRVIVPVSGISLNIKETTITKGYTDILIATILPEDATNKNIQWKSSDASIVKISSTGEFTGLQIGEATISVISEDQQKNAQCVIKVVSPNDVEYLPYDKEQEWK